MLWWSFEFATACVKPTCVNDLIMNIEDHSKIENAKCWLLRFSFEQVQTVFIRSFSKPFRLFIFLVHRPCFFVVSNALASIGIILICQEKLFASLCLFFRILFLKIFSWRSFYAMAKFWPWSCPGQPYKCQWPCHEQQRLHRETNRKVLTS